MINSPDERLNELAAETQASKDDLRLAGREMLQSSTVSGQALLRILAIAHLRGLDASALVANLAVEFPSYTGRQLQQLAAVLSTGTPPVQAVAQTPGVLDQTAVIALRLADDSGNLPRLYEILLEAGDIHNLDDEPHQSPATELIRVGILFFVAMVMITFLSLFVVPTFEQMFDEFGLTLPSLMLFLLAVNEFLPLVFVMGLALVALYLAVQAPAINQSFQKRIDPLNGGRRILSGSIGLLSLMAIVFHSGRDFVAGLSTIAQYHHNPRTRRRLDRACLRIDQGSEPWGALAAERLVSRREARALSQAASNQMQSWLLEWSIAERQRGKRTRTHCITRALTLFGMLLLGAIVGLTSISVFMVLYELVTGLT